MGGDLDYFRENDPFALAAKNADALRDRSFIRIICHIENENWLAPQCEKLHQVLMDHTIPHQFLYLSNVKSHNAGQVTATLGDAGLMFFGSVVCASGANQAARAVARTAIGNRISCALRR